MDTMGDSTDSRTADSDEAVVTAGGRVQGSPTSHTNGPWSCRETGDTQWLVTSRTQYICNTLHGNDEANAHLIAAAPDLLAALKLYVDHFGDPLKVARAAIAKAEGQ